MCLRRRLLDTVPGEEMAKAREVMHVINEKLAAVDKDASAAASGGSDAALILPKSQ